MRIRSLITAAVAALLATAGLLVSGAPPGLAASTTGTSLSGCGVKVSTGSATLSLDIDTHVRTVIVHVPGGYSSEHRTPLVLNLHGSGTTAHDQELFSGMDATSDSGDFLVAYPQGLIPEGSGFDWNVPGVPLVGGSSVPADAANDVKFLTDLVPALSNRYCIDPARVYATGFSGGARMSSQLACDSAGTFAAVAPVSGLRRPTPCPATRAVPIISFHGTADPVDPYQGHGEAYWVYSVQQAEQLWGVQQEKCATSVVSHPASTVTLTSYEGCVDDSVVELYSVKGAGHEWPGGPKLPKLLTSELGPQSFAIDADQTIWSFFKSHRLPVR